MADVHDILNEGDYEKYTYHTWQETLKWIKTSKSFSKVKIKLMFNDKKIKFHEAIEQLLKSYSADPTLQKTWAQVGFDQFLTLFKIAMPREYALR